MSSQLQQMQILPSLVAGTALGWVVVTAQPVIAASLIPVDTELSLLVDVSPSIGRRDYNLQIEGYQTAFTNVSSRFGGGDFGSVAVNLIQWSGDDDQEESVPWTLLNDEASVLQFVETLADLEKPRGFSGTIPGSAIAFATPLFSNNEYAGQRWVMDVSGDGPQNSRFGVDSPTARDNALAAGVDAINGLPILSSRRSTLDDWYRDNIQGGEGSFTIAASGFEDIGRALETKLIAELTLPPTEPAPPVVAPAPPVVAPAPPVIAPAPPVVAPAPPVIAPAPPVIASAPPVSKNDRPVDVPEPMTVWGLGAVVAGLLCRQRRHLADS